MSLGALSADPPRPDPRDRLVLAAAAVVIVAAAVALALWAASSAGVAPPARHPFGMGIREAGPTPSGLGALLLAWQAAFFAALRGALAAVRDGREGLPILVGIGFAYGVFHAAGPGHGKAVIAAYLVSSEKVLARGLGVSLAAALIQALVAIALVTVVFGLVGATAATMARTASAVEIAGFALVAGLGAVLVWRKAGQLATLLADGPSAGVGGRAGPCECGHVDPAETGRSLGQMAGVALGAGIRPCAGALVVLTLSRAYGIYPAGIAATLAMAFGTAVTTGALALLSVFAKRAALALASRGRRAPVLAAAAAELAAASFVLVIGLALLAGWWDGGLGT